MRTGRFLALGLGCLLATAPLAAAVETLSGLVFGGLPEREVRIYLPPGGVKPSTPVLVALDGQAMPAWKLEETLAALAAKRGPVVPLVVAIPAGEGEARVEEYGLAGRPDFAGRGRKAAEFQRFVVQVVLPAVRLRYKVRTDPSRTGVMGASLGGLAAFDLAWHYPQTFGFAGIFSGALWWRGDDATPAARQASRLVHRIVSETVPAPSVRLWLEAGTADERADRDGNGVIDSIQDTTDLMRELEKHGFRRGPDIEYLEVEGGRHHEATWARALPEFLEWALPRD